MALGSVGAPSRWLGQRALLDRILCALAAVPLAPVALVLGAIIKATSPGPAAIRLPRIGAGGRRFDLWKLRSMRVLDPSEQQAGSITTADDDRITPVGRAVRRWRLDEIPQLANVVAGQMALIGPRPEAPKFVDPHDPRWAFVLEARPAIAGPTQLLVHEWETTLSGDDAYQRDVLPVKLAIDAWYVANASPTIDALVVVGLAQSLLLRRHDTSLHRLVRREVPEAAAIPTH